MTDDYAIADAVRVEAYGVLRLMDACGLEHVRGQTRAVWALRYAVAAHMMTLATPHTHMERQAA
jgi:hypothetical protein